MYINLHCINRIRIGILLGALLFGPIAFAADGTPEALVPRQWANAAQVATDHKDYALAVTNFRKAIDGGYVNAGVMYDLAVAYALQNQTQPALDALQKSAELGMHSALALQSDTDLDALHGDPKWAGIVAQVEKNAQTYHATHNDPNGFKYVTSDIDLFWQTYDQLGSTKNRPLLWERNYLERGTPGLQDFIHNRIGSGERLDDTVQQLSRFYASIRANTARVAGYEPTVRESMRKFKTLYQDANFPDVYFVIGAFNSGGTATDAGLIMGTEVFSLGPQVVLDELDHWRRSVLGDADQMPNIVAHELMHFQQDYDAKDLLGTAIREGSADFLASLISTGNFNQHVYDYGYAHEADLKQQFLQDVAKNDKHNWLYNGNNVKDRPADLGYFMGFRITQAYYQRATDKTQAIVEILHIRDFKQFVEKSGYFANATLATP